MKLYIYRGLDGEKAPKDVTHVIVDSSVTVIKKNAFFCCEHLVSVIMGDYVKRIEWFAFCHCCALRFVRLSKTLEYIGQSAFNGCHSMEAVFLPSTVKEIGGWAFYCRSLRLLILPNDIDLHNVWREIINDTAIYQIAENAGVEYEYDGNLEVANEDSNRRVNEWLLHHMDEAPFHKLCYDSSITTKHIIDYLNEHGNDSALAIDAIHGMTPLHMLSMNPHAPSDAVASLLDSNMEACCLDYQQKAPLDYARDYNVGGLIAMITGLCNRRNSLILVGTDTKNSENVTKRRKIGNN